MEIYVSSMALRELSIESMIETCSKAGFALEFSSGIPFRTDLKDLYLKASCRKLVHNYFPPPANPFVLNLASRNHEIRSLSLTHCKQGIDLSAQSGSLFYAAHAGFCLDPKPHELGRQIRFELNLDREMHRVIFQESLIELEAYAKKVNIQFLIENNVLTQSNFLSETNPLLCVDSTEIKDVLSSFDSVANIGLLLDTGHLKVSCNTLGLNIEDQLENLKPFIKAIHHSDNDGISDTNDPLTKSYWFLEYMNYFQSIPHIIEVKDLSPYELNKHINLLNESAC